MHGAKREYLIVFLNFPVKTEAIRDLQERLVVIWQQIGPVLFLPFRDGALRDTLPLSELYICDADVVFEETDHREGDVVEDLPDALLVHYLNY